MAQRYRLDPDELSPADLKRAKAGPLGGRNPYELLNGGDEGDKLTLIIWCLLSRDTPDLTWEQAEGTPFKAFDSPVADIMPDGGPPPPTASPGEPGARPEPSESSSDDATRNPNGTPPGSAASTASVPTSTTG